MGAGSEWTERVDIRKRFLAIGADNDNSGGDNNVRDELKSRRWKIPHFSYILIAFI